jgi:hypothetical protein
MLPELREWAAGVRECGNRSAQKRAEVSEAREAYLRIPDLSSLAANQEVAPNLQNEGIQNTPFTAAEQAEIATRIEEIKKETRQNPELTAEQISGIERKLDDLKEASDRVGREDWLTILYGTAFGMIVTDLVPPHIVQGTIATVIAGLGHIFGLGGLPPALPAQG